MSKYAVLTFLLLGMVVVSDCKRCHGYYWRRYGNTCYFFSDSAATWFDAQTVCRLLGGKLAEFQYKSRERFLMHASSQYRRSYWVGGSDLRHEGHWQWITSGIYISSRTAWAPKQPDNWKGREDCMSYWYSARGWNDAGCYSRIHFICEK